MSMCVCVCVFVGGVNARRGRLVELDGKIPFIVALAF